MKKFGIVIGGALLLGSSPLSAQVTVNGLGACFGNNSANTAVSSCNNSSSSTTWSMPGGASYWDSRFMFDRSTLLNGAGGNSVGLTFGGDDKSSILYMGWFRFDEGTDGSDANAKLNFNVYINNLAGGSLAYNSLQVNYDYRSSGAERWNFSGAGWSSWFGLTGDADYEYRFAVVGFDYPHPGSASNYCKTYDAVPSSGYYYDDPNGGKLCGQFERRSLTTTTTVTPEPSTYVLMAAGLAGIGFVGRRRRSA